MIAALLFVMWIGCCVLVGWLAARKGRKSAHWIALALLLTVGFFLAALPYNYPQYRTSADGTPRLYSSPVSSPAGAFLGPLLAFLAVAVSSNRNRRKCPDCGETIQASARLCRYCRHEFDYAAGRMPNRSRA